MTSTDEDRELTPDDFDYGRIWTYPKAGWQPAWWHKAGVPSFGSDEWGRKVIVFGLGFLGYIAFAYRTCWCPSCHIVRLQTYRELQEVLDRVA